MRAVRVMACKLYIILVGQFNAEYRIKGLLLFCIDTAGFDTSVTLDAVTALASKPKKDIRNKPRKDTQLIIRLNLFFIQTPFLDYNLFLSKIEVF